MRYVYILRCADNSLYTGITKNIKKRLEEHNNSTLGAKYTRNRRPVKLVRSQEAPDRSEASKLERKIKKMKKWEKEKMNLNSVNILNN